MAETDALGQQGSQDSQPNQQDEAVRTQQTKEALAKAIRKKKGLQLMLAAIAFILLTQSPPPGCDRRDSCQGKLNQVFGRGYEDSANQADPGVIASPC